MPSQSSICPIERFPNLCTIVELSQIRNTHIINKERVQKIIPSREIVFDQMKRFESFFALLLNEIPFQKAKCKGMSYKKSPLSY